MSDEPFVPADFAVPGGLTAGPFRLEPLGPQHNAADYAAWTASTGHIRATPGFAGTSWPHPMSLADNLRDLERHAQDFAERRGFTYTVLSTADGDVIGCVYIYPPPGHTQQDTNPDAPQARVRSWVRADHAALDPCSTARSWPGWNTPGHSAPSTTPPAHNHPTSPGSPRRGRYRAVCPSARCP